MTIGLVFRPGEDDVPKVHPQLPGLKGIRYFLPLLEDFMHDHEQSEHKVCDFSELKLSFSHIQQFAVWLTYHDNIEVHMLDLSSNRICCETWQCLVNLLNILAPYANVIDFRNNYLPAHDESDLHSIPAHVLLGPKAEKDEPEIC